MCKYAITAVAFIVATALAAPAALADGAATPDDVFSMTLPEGYAGFTKQVQKASSPEGEIETTNWISKAPTGEAVVVTLSRMPGKILDPQKLIASTRASLLKSLGATVESEDASAGDAASVLFRSDAAWFRAQYTVVDDRLYQVLYVGRSAEQRSAPAVSGIFDSFRLTGTAAPFTAQR